MTLAIDENFKLAPFTSWQVGGPADFLARPRTVDEVREAQEWAARQKLPLHILGGGSNVLISDKGLRGLTILLKELTGTQMREEGGRLHIECLSGTGKSDLLKIFLKHKLAPALFLAGLPGDVGGGIVMNAGVGEALVPREFTEITEWVEVLKPDGSVQRYRHGDIQWSYRHSQGWQPGTIVRAGISWPMEPDPEVLAKVREANRIRLTKQPLDLPSCGSVFVNPPGEKAARLIESSGLKGLTEGGAQVSLKHANFIVNKGGATARDIAALIGKVRETVLAKTGIELKTEVVFMGDFSGLKEAAR